jgi:hypothetical protein
LLAVAKLIKWAVVEGRKNGDGCCKPATGPGESNGAGLGGFSCLRKLICGIFVWGKKFSNQRNFWIYAKNTIIVNGVDEFLKNSRCYVFTTFL